MKTRHAAAGMCVVLAVLTCASAVAAAPIHGLAAAVFLPADEAKRFVGSEHGALGVGVFPDSRDASEFWRAVSAGSPIKTAGEASPLGGVLCSLPSLFQDFLKPGGADPSSEPSAAARLAFCDRVAAVASSPLRVISAATADEARVELERSDLSTGASVMVFGTAKSTPLVIGLTTWGESRPGILDGGIARRPGIVTPYDVAATLIDIAGLKHPPTGFIGHVLHVKRDADPARSVQALSARLERDCCFGHGISAATITIMAGIGVILTGVLLLLGASRIALRSARGAAAAVLGYVVSLFVPSGNAALRSIPLVIAYVIAFVLPLSDAATTRREIGKLLGLGAFSIAVLTILAALRPGGEPALSLWGDPLVSWRLFGLRNHLTSMLQLGAIAGLVVGMRKANLRWHVAAAVAATVVVGAPFLGANFVAVLTLSFGAAVVTAVLAQRKVTVKGIIVSGLIAVATFVIALLSDAGSPVSHGGQAVQRVRAGGIRSAYDFASIRFRLNIHEIRNLWGGWVWTAGLIIGLVLIFRWAARDNTLPIAVRAAMAGGAAAAFAALLAEDTGFLAGGTMALAPWLVAVTAIVERREGATREFVNDGAG